MSPLSAPLAGVSAAFARYDRAAVETVKAASDVGGGSLESAVAAQIQAEVQARASLSVLRSADRIYAALLDIRV